ncbi:MAG: GNAT family N-acetyltransferase [Pseudomonadota bacterium]
MSGRYRIETLVRQPGRAAFRSGSETLDRYLHRQASQDVRRRVTACFVAIAHEAEVISGYYTLSATSIALTQLSEEQAGRLPHYPHIPAALLGRLAVGLEHQGRGLGGALLIDALRRASDVEMGVYAMLIEAKDAQAQAFYEHYGFIALQQRDARRLMLPMSTAKEVMGQ